MTARDDADAKVGFINSLVERELVTESAGQRILAAIEATGHPIDTVLTELGLMREEIFAREAADYLGAAVAEGPLSTTDADLTKELGIEFLAASSIVPMRHDERTLIVAVADPFDRRALTMIEYQLERPVEIRAAPRSAITAALTQLRQQLDASETISVEGVSEAYEGDLERLRDFAQQAPIVRFVSKVTQKAFEEGATDIHFEPEEDTLRVRIRVDGDLKPIEVVSGDLLPGVSTRIKILSGLDISERRLPQDGRMRLAVRGQELDLRVSIAPTINGETIVLRILDRSTVALDLTALGFDQTARRQLATLTQSPNGILLVSGPTGSGKTTTLYALISQLSRPDLKIFTVEDPVEYRMVGVTQLQVNSTTGLTFARALRSVLRQDPDIILVGEIRDKETAEIAMQAALTGHLVLSTVHTNSAVGAVTRLRDMGIESYLIAATVKCVIGQRLLRKSCGCGANDPSCTRCGGSGYKGRTVTYEIAEMGRGAAMRISAGEDEDGIAQDLARQGFVPMEQHALRLVQTGVTTSEEIARVVRLTGGDV